MKNYLSFALDVFGALILPGFGQFLQGRFRLAIAFFLSFAFSIMFAFSLSPVIYVCSVWSAIAYAYQNFGAKKKTE